MQYATRLVRLILSGILLTLTLVNSVSANVVASIRPLAFISAAITDGVTSTEILLPDGVSPHDYALRPSDIQRLSQADLVVWIGPEMEVFLNKPMQKIDQQRQIELMDVAAIQPLLISNNQAEEGENDHHDTHSHKTSELHLHHHEHGQFDSHIWLSPAIAKQVALAIHDRLVVQMPENKAKLDENLYKFVQELEHTEQNLAKILKPMHGKGYFVFHDAYRYFENHFGLTQLGHFTVNPEIQPGAQRLHQIRIKLVEHNAVCVFAEPQFRPAVINTVAQDTNVRKGTLDPLGSDIELSRDSYVRFLTQLSQQFTHCLIGNS